MPFPPFARRLPAAAIHALLFADGRARVERNERTLRLLAHHKRWREAQAFVEARRLGPADVASAWLLPHIARCAVSPASTGDPAAVGGRIGLLGRDVEVLATRPLSGGVSSLAMYLHRVRTPAGETLSMVEKVYPGERRMRARDEARLFAELDHRQLLAPRFYGKVVHEGLLSMFYAWVPGGPAPRAAFRGIHNDLVARLWLATPTPRLVRAMGARAGRPAVEAASLFAATPAGTDALERARSRILSVLEAACGAEPGSAFVMHADLHSGNCLLDADGAHVLVDWDRFQLLPVGFGLLLTREHFTSPAFGEWLADKVAAAPGRSLPQVREQVAMDQVLRCTRTGDHEGAREWAREIG
ncbi:MAG TPA: phosphotransferase [Ramlibacter sp.]